SRAYSMAVAPLSSPIKLLIVATSMHAPRPARFGLEQITQGGDQRLVRRWHGVVPQLLRPHPFEGRMLPRLRHALPFPAGVKWHQQVNIVVRVTGEGNRSQARRLGGNAQFFLQLADQRLL